MPRRSANSLAVAPVVDVARIRLAARAELPPSERRVFADLVRAVDASHFREADRVMLEQLARAIAIERQAAEALYEQGLIVDGAPNPLIRVVREQSRLIASLATKCRLTTQARVSKDKAGATARPVFDPDALLAQLEQMEVTNADS